ncbi:cytochrome P450 [Crepidotus variabilis]|uniref:Cytochrome P450 n=1 Tax=Crepidotus variabilis TaxID=179855 RepID=A0A9P6JMM2_9AGAR|nr:cytochrome P450 [Crepidotus variabilis]
MTYLIIFLALFAAIGHRIARSIRQQNSRIPIVPSTLPWFGNFFEFRRDPVHFMQSCRQKYGPVYKILLAGQKIIVLSHQKGITLLNKDSARCFTSTPIHRRVLTTIGGVNANQEHLLDVMDTKLYPPLMKSLSPASMVPMADNIHQNLQRELREIGHITKAPLLLRLDELISRPLYRAGCLTLFGPTFPLDTFDDFHLFDSKFSQLILGLPFVAQDATLACQRLATSFAAYLVPLWSEESTEGVSEIIAASIQEMRGLVTLQEAARLLMLFVVGFHSNTSSMIFWLLSHILQQDLSGRLRQELHAAQTTEVNTPLMSSAITEVLRWATTNTTVRVATKHTSIMVDGEPIPIRKGESVIADVQSLHYDPAIYSNPDEFMVDRFLESDSGVSIPKPLAFGGGAHLCPGRHLAQVEIKHFLSTLLQMYEIKAVIKEGTKPKLPMVDKRDLVGTLRTNEAFYVAVWPVDT